MPKHFKQYKEGTEEYEEAYKEHIQAGGEVTDVAEVIAEVAQMGQEFPTTNAMERSESYQLGGPVRPPTAPSRPQYKEGGKLEDWKEEGYEWSTKELKRRILGQERGTDITDIVKLRSRRQGEIKKSKKGKKK